MEHVNYMSLSYQMEPYTNNVDDLNIYENSPDV